MYYTTNMWIFSRFSHWKKNQKLTSRGTDVHLAHKSKNSIKVPTDFISFKFKS